MGVAGYFPGGLRDLQKELKNVAAELRGQGDAAVEPFGPAEDRDRYDLVEDYDPVLRAHCRLERHGNPKILK
jgi:hypothetical protein